MAEKKKILVSVANERGAYLPILEVELEEKDLKNLLGNLRNHESSEESGDEASEEPTPDTPDEG